MINRYRRISFSWSALILGTESAPAPRRGHFRGLPPAECVKAIIRHAPRFARRDLHRAAATPKKIFQCCQRAPLSVPARGDCSVTRLGDDRHRWLTAEPTTA